MNKDDLLIGFMSIMDDENPSPKKEGFGTIGLIVILLILTVCCLSGGIF